MENTRRQSATTHGAPQCLDACAFFTELLLDAFDGVAKDRILTPRELDGHPAVTSVAGGSYRDLSRDEISSSGYVVDTLEAALWAFHKARSFREAVLLAANLGDDADTVAAVTGQIAGAFWGCESMPEAWHKRVAWHDEIRSTTNDCDCTPHDPHEPIQRLVTLIARRTAETHLEDERRYDKKLRRRHGAAVAHGCCTSPFDGS